MKNYEVFYFYYILLFKVDGSWRLCVIGKIIKWKTEEDINLSLRQEGKVFILGPKVFLTGI